MTRLDFSSVMAIIRYYISPDHGMNQGELLDELFYSIHAESKDPIIFDGASVNRWLKGTERVSPIISRYYLKKRNQEKLANDIEQYILPLMYDSNMAVQELYRLTVQDTTISDRQKKKLLKAYPCDTEQDAACLIATLFCFSMERTFVRRTPGNMALMTTGSLSSASADFILNNHAPAPCRHFCGRDGELSVLHGLLSEHGKVFISGLPGIGKSELAKAYAKQRKADYTNIVHLYYTGSLREDITRMDFVDDLSDDTADARYERHARFLRTLKEDTLLIVDNFNVTAEEDSLLAVVMDYRRKVLFTTRCRFEEYPMLELNEISNNQTLLHLMGCFYTEAGHHQNTLQQIINAVHSHTLAVELAARLLETGMLEPHALLTKLQAEKASFADSDTINIHKDGHSTKTTYYRHIHTLFSLYHLTTAERDAMRSLCFAPPDGISARLLAKWLRQDNLNTINGLIEMGFVQTQPGRIIALHPLVQEIALEELKPSILNCHTLLDSLHVIFLRHGEESPHMPDTPATEHILGSRSLEKGAKGTDVKTLQGLLLQLGFSLPKYGTDGSFGTETLSALKVFQSRAGIKADGIYGTESHAALMAATADRDEALKPSEPEDGEETPGTVGKKVAISCVSGTVNIRTGNGTQYSRITAAKNGDTFDWVATAENGWHAVVVNGCVGWVSGKYSKAE